MLGVSDESEELVSAYVEKMGLSVRVSAGFSGGEAWGVRGYPSAVLINAEGVVTWTGDPRSLSSSKVKDALKGAKGSKGGYLGFSTPDELSSKLGGAAKAAAGGKLAKAIADANRLAADEKQPQALRDEASEFAEQVLAHATLLRDQAETFIGQRSMVKGIGVLESVAGAMKGTEFATAIDTRLAAIEKDEDLQNELAGEEALIKAMEAAEKRGMKKSVKKFESVVKNFEGTRAATRAAKKIRMM